MKILIYGAGAVGSYIGAHLALGGHDVTLLGRERLRAGISENGFSIHHADQSKQRIDNVQIATSLEEALHSQDMFDWIAFTMKSYDTAASAAELQEFLPIPPPIASFQNGIGNEELLRSYFGPAAVVAGTLTTPVSMQDDSTVIEEKARGIAISADSPSAKIVESALRQTTLTLSIVEREDSLKWSKLLLNITANAVPAILDLHPGEVFRSPDLFDIEWLALRELIDIMRLSGISIENLPGAPSRTLAMAIRHVPKRLLRPILLKKVGSGRGDKLPSLLLALRYSSRRTEIAWLNGAVVSKAKELNKFAPVNHAIALTLSDITAGRASWDMYRNDPSLLLSSINMVKSPW